MAQENLQGKVVLITGAARRIGRAMALAFAAEGAGVVIHYNTSEAEARALQHDLQAGGAQAWILQADFAQDPSAGCLVNRALVKAGRLDVLINNASRFPPVRTAEVEFDDLVTAMQVDAWAPFSLSREFCETLRQGKIINLIDSRVDDYDFNHVSYILAKHALHKMTEMLALKYAPGVAINAIMPGLILPPPDKDEAFLDSLTHTVPLHRHGDPEDIAAAAVFLAKSTFMTGAAIYVDGGRHLKEYGHGSSDPDQ